MNLNVRKLCAEEVFKLSHLYDEPSNPSFMEKRKEKIVNRIQDVYVLENEYNIIGEVTIVYQDDHEGFTIKGQRVYMEALRIDKSMHDKGYGQYFIIAVNEKIKNEGYQEITIGVEDDNLNAKHIYNKLGFTEFVSREQMYKYAPKGYDVWMKRLI